MFRRFLIAAVILLQGCAGLPLVTSRDAAILPQGETRDEFSASSPAVYTGTNFAPTAFGGTVVEYQRRSGLAGERERAFRVGAVSGIAGLSGAYGGFELAKSLRKGTRKWGTAGYVGGVAGFDSLFGSYLPAHKFAQLYLGMVAGKVAGGSRPELNVRLGVQGGAFVDDPYAAAVLTLEPRYRFSLWNRLGYIGLGLDGGYMLCQDCAAGPEQARKYVFGFHPTVGFSFP